MHRFNSRFPGFETYISLYEQSVLEGGISLQKELKTKASSHDLAARVHLLTVLYLLGLMEPAGARPPNNSGVIGRLISRIRNT